MAARVPGPTRRTSSRGSGSGFAPAGVGQLTSFPVATATGPAAARKPSGDVWFWSCCGRCTALTTAVVLGGQRNQADPRVAAVSGRSPHYRAPAEHGGAASVAARRQVDVDVVRLVVAGSRVPARRPPDARGSDFSSPVARRGARRQCRDAIRSERRRRGAGREHVATSAHRAKVPTWPRRRSTSQGSVVQRLEEPLDRDP